MRVSGQMCEFSALGVAQKKISNRPRVDRDLPRLKLTHSQLTQIKFMRVSLQNQLNSHIVDHTNSFRNSCLPSKLTQNPHKSKIGQIARTQSKIKYATFLFIFRT
jgi:hypothetical protein